MIKLESDKKSMIMNALLQCKPLLIILTLIKTLYVYTKIPGTANISISIFSSIPILIVCYGIIGVIAEKNKLKYQLILHSIISFILFSDLIYFSYFSVLPSVYDLKQMGEVSDVWSSVQSLLKPTHFLVFADLIVIPFLYIKDLKSNHIVHIDKSCKKASVTLVILMLILSFTNMMLVYGQETATSYVEYGILNYHILDIAKAVIKTNADDQNVDPQNFNASLDHNESKKNELFGVAKGRNVIVIQVEALQNFVIDRKYEDQEITPNLNKLLKKDTIYFDRYYYTVSNGNTSDAEFAVQNSLYPVSKVSAYKTYDKNTFYALPKLLKDNGYSKAKAFHGYKPDFWNRNVMYPVLGFDQFISAEDFNIDETIGLGLSDESFFKQSIPYLKEMESPFYSFMVTLSSHNPFNMNNKYKKIELLDKHKKTMFGDYLNSIHYADYSLGKFIEDLKKEGLYDNSIIAVYGDHFGLSGTDKKNSKVMSEFLGREYTYDEYTNVPFIINIPGVQQEVPKKVSVVGSHMDFYPTLINLLGIQTPDVPIFGQDLINSEKGFVVLRNFLTAGSFIDDDKILVIHAGQTIDTAVAWDLNTKEKINVETCRDSYEKALNEIKQSDYILNNDLIKTMISDGIR